MSFLMLTNVFRDYINVYGDFEYPFKTLINPYHPRKKIVWSPEGVKAFEDMKLAVLNRETLYF